MEASQRDQKSICIYMKVRQITSFKQICNESNSEVYLSFKIFIPYEQALPTKYSLKRNKEYPPLNNKVKERGKASDIITKDICKSRWSQPPQTL